MRIDSHFGKAVAEMDKVVQKKAAGAEESASVAEVMQAQVGLFKGYVGKRLAIMGRNGPIPSSFFLPVKRNGSVPPVGGLSKASR